MPIVDHRLYLDLNLSIHDFIGLEAEVIIPLQIQVTNWTFDATYKDMIDAY